MCPLPQRAPGGDKVSGIAVATGWTVTDVLITRNDSIEAAIAQAP
jgi:hypothetical protein